MKTRNGWKYAGFGLLGIAALFGFTLVVMLLWNALVPNLFNGPEVNYWQTLGLLVLAKILFSGMGGGHRRDSRWRPGTDWHHSRQHPPMSEKYREKMREHFEKKMNEMSAEDGEKQEEAK